MEDVLTDEEHSRYIKEWATQIITLDGMIKNDEQLVDAILSISADSLKFAVELRLGEKPGF